MNPSQTTSRRDWLQTLLSKQRSPLLGNHQADNGDGSSPTWENSDGVPPDLPPMREAWLSETQVRQLFSDIESAATDIRLMQRRTRSADSSHPLPLQQVASALLSGGLSKVQIRYRWNQAAWIDTLEAHPNQQFRLVRISHPYQE